MTGANPGEEAPAGVRDPLLVEEWSYIGKGALNDFTPAEFDLLNAQRRQYQARYQADAVLGLFSAGEGDPVFGYQINQYRHGLQSATLLLRAGYDEEDVVVGLLHDVGFVACPDRHGAFAAELLGAYVSERNVWMLRHHQPVGSFGPQAGDAREDWSRHPHYEWARRFVEEFDQNAMDPSYDSLPLLVFEPMVRRIFARPPHPVPESG